MSQELCKHKIFIFNNGGPASWLQGIALGNDGMFTTSHISSTEFWIRYDLGITSNWKHDKYDAHFGEGNWELEWVPNPAAHEGLNAAIALFEKNHPDGEGEDAERF